MRLLVLCNKGSISINEKNVKKLVLENTKSAYSRRGIVTSKIKQDDVIFMSRIIAKKICSSSRDNDMVVGFVQEAYKICADKEKFNLSEVLRE